MFYVSVVDEDAATLLLGCCMHHATCNCWMIIMTTS